MAERVGFNALNAESCMALQRLVRGLKTKELMRLLLFARVRGTDMKANSAKECSTASQNVAR